MAFIGLGEAEMMATLASDGEKSDDPAPDRGQMPPTRNSEEPKKCSTLETGVDVVARDARTGIRWRLEAKGGTSSKPGTRRYGQPFNRSQVKTHVSVAFFYAAKLQQTFPDKTDRVALAFPDDKLHRAVVADIISALDKLKIPVVFVDQKGNLSVIPGESGFPV